MSFIILLSYLLIYFIRPAEWISWLAINWQLYLGIIAILIILDHYIFKPREFYEDKYGLLVVCFFSVVLLSKAATGWLGGAIVIAETLLPSIVIYFLIQISCTNIKRLKVALIFIMCLTSIICISAILQYTTGEGFGGLTPIERVIEGKELQETIPTLQVRWYGVFNDPNDLGMLLIVCVPFAVQQLLSKHYLYLIPLSLSMTGIFMTNSRGTFLALVVTIIAYFLLKTKNLRGLLSAGSLCIILVVLGPSRISQITPSEESAIGRLEAWIAAFQMFKQSPIIGIGPGNFTDHYFITAHNSYMLALAETGFLGLMFFIGITLVPSWNGIKMIFNASPTTTEENLLPSVLAAFIGICFSIFFISRTYMMIPFMMSGFAVACMKIYNPESYKNSSALIKSSQLIKSTLLFIFIMFCIAKLTVLLN
jgi:putative inorganic carbon (hco3(-)) transporter